MEVGPFRTVPASQTSSGMVELRLVEGGWEEFATIVFGELVDRGRGGMVGLAERYADTGP
jgi:hypothetical protein